MKHITQILYSKFYWHFGKLYISKMLMFNFDDQHAMEVEGITTTNTNNSTQLLTLIIFIAPINLA